MSNEPKNFIDRRVFEHTIGSVPRCDGEQYEDLKTIYGDMSRLVVAWLACTSPDKLRSLYNDLGWKGSANVNAIHRTAKAWLNEHHPDRCPIVPDGDKADE